MNWREKMKDKNIGERLGFVSPINHILPEERIRHRVHKHYPSSPFSFCRTDIVGLEVEVENIINPTHIFPTSEGHVWRCTEDGSLRNNGIEYVSVPLSTEDVEWALVNLFKSFTGSSKWRGYEFSERTSIHVHMNVLDMSYEQLQTLLLAYILVEPILYSYVSGGRDKNIFCVPLKESPFFSLGLAKVIKSIDKGTFNDFIRNGWSKYTGLNLMPIIKYGSIEFRHLVGTDNIPFILNWINLILGIKDFAMKVRYEDLINSLQSINTSSEYLPLLESIIPDTTILEKSAYNYVKDMEQKAIIIKGSLVAAQQEQKLSLREVVDKGQLNSLFFEWLKENKYISKYEMLIRSTPKSLRTAVTLDELVRQETNVQALSNILIDF